MIRGPRRSLVGSVIVLIAALNLLIGCAADPGGAAFRPTDRQRYYAWEDTVHEQLNTYSKTYVATSKRLKAGEVSPAEAEFQATSFAEAARQLSKALEEHPYPGAPPLTEAFQPRFIGLLTELDHAADQMIGCRRDCTEVFTRLHTLAVDIWQIVLAVVSYDRVTSPQATRRHQITDGLLDSEYLGANWTATDAELSGLAALCQPGQQEAVPPVPFESDQSLVGNTKSRALAEHRILRFADQGAAAQYVDDLRLRVAYCAQRPETRDGLNYSWSSLVLSTDVDLPSASWRTANETAGGRTIELTTLVVLAADTVSQVTVVANGKKAASDLTESLSDQALVRLRVEVPA